MGDMGKVPAPKVKRIVVEKRWYFTEVYKNDKVQEDGINMCKNQMSIEIFVSKFKFFLRNISIPIGFLAQSRRNLPLFFLRTFRLIKAFQYKIKLSFPFIKGRILQKERE